MIPPKQIGKHSIQLQDVRSIIAVRHWFFWTRYNVQLGNQIIRLTPKEKAELDKALEVHINTIGIYQLMINSASFQMQNANRRKHG